MARRADAPGQVEAAPAASGGAAARGDPRDEQRGRVLRAQPRPVVRARDARTDGDRRGRFVFSEPRPDDRARERQRRPHPQRRRAQQAGARDPGRKRGAEAGERRTCGRIERGRRVR